MQAEIYFYRDSVPRKTLGNFSPPEEGGGNTCVYSVVDCGKCSFPVCLGWGFSFSFSFFFAKAKAVVVNPPPPLLPRCWKRWANAGKSWGRVVRNGATRKEGTRETQRAHQEKLKEILLTFSSDDSVSWEKCKWVKLLCIFRTESRPLNFFCCLTCFAWLRCPVGLVLGTPPKIERRPFLLLLPFDQHRV